MTLYLDTSALIKLYVEEAGSEQVHDAVAGSDVVSTSALAYVEARSAFARRVREGHMNRSERSGVVRALDADFPKYFAINVSDDLLKHAAELTESRSLRAYDAVHLASAIALKKRLDDPVTFATWDKNLGAAAKKEGLAPLTPESGTAT